MNNSKTAIIAIMAILASCSHNHGDEHAEDAHSDAHDHAELIELPDAQAERFGVKVDTVFPGPFATVIPAVGVIERSASDAAGAVAPTAGIVR